MSIRTIVEINHDYLAELLSRDRDAVDEFLAALGSTEDSARQHAPRGIKFLRQRHNSEKVTLTVE